MKSVLRVLAVAVTMMVAAPAVGQVLLLDLTTSVPLAAAMDNPCTAETEAIAFQGATELTQKVWLMPVGTLRLQVAERTAMQGSDTLATLLGSGAKYVVDAAGSRDVEFDPVALSLVMFKKVTREGSADNFHSALVMDFDPQTLRLNLSLEAACDNGQP
jgi:hypothetical protein